MAFHMSSVKRKCRPTAIPVMVFIILICGFVLLFSLISTQKLTYSYAKTLEIVFKFSKSSPTMYGYVKYLYWGNMIDCPGKHCRFCEGLAHQESSLRCALEEAIVLQRTFVMPSRMCLNPIHNTKGTSNSSRNSSSEERWEANFTSMDSLYDTDLISHTVPIILDNSKEWYRVLSISMRLGARGIAHVQGLSRLDLKNSNYYSNILIINRTANPFSWFMECRDRKNRSAVLLSYSFLPSMVSKELRTAAEKIITLLGDYDAIHVRRGDKIRTRKDKNGIRRSLHPHLDRDTRPAFIIERIKEWVPYGRTLFIASNEKEPGFFIPLSTRYKVVYSKNYSWIIEHMIDNNYKLFMIERVILMHANTYIETFKDDGTPFSLTDDPKKNTKNWQIPIYT